MMPVIVRLAKKADAGKSAMGGREVVSGNGILSVRYFGFSAPFPVPNSFFEEVFGVSEPTKRLKVYGSREEMDVTD